MTSAHRALELDVLPSHLLRRVLDLLDAGIVVRDAGGDVVALNAPARRLIALAPHLGAPGWRGDREHLVPEEGGRGRWIDERRARLGPGGMEVAVLRDTTRQRLGEDQLTQALAEMSETYAELEVARDEIARTARTDPLTGAATRGHAAEVLSEMLAGGRAPGLLLLDVDNFKRINDTHGHAAGDTVLEDVVRRVSLAVRRDDLVARWGGEEFLVVVPGGPPPTALADLGEWIRAAVARTPVSTSTADVPVTVSVGASVAGTPAPSPDALVAAADVALYAAKDAGRDRVRLAPAPVRAGVVA